MSHWESLTKSLVIVYAMSEFISKCQIVHHNYIQSGAKGHLHRLRDERGGQDEQFSYIPKYMCIDLFAVRDANKVNRLGGVWERKYCVTL